jgi:hypothetical protein
MRQMANLMEIRSKQSAGGQKGAAITNGSRRRDDTQAGQRQVERYSGQSASQPSGQPASPEGSGIEVNREDVSQRQSVVKAGYSSDGEHAKWIRDYEAADTDSSMPKALE